MPGNVFDNTFTVANGGCGPCDATAKAANKCAECDSAECNVMPSPIKCIQGDGSDMTAKDCLPAQGETTPTKCSQAKFVDYTGLAAGQNYACGACAANSDAKCQDCTGKSDAACNTKIETAESFKCYDYELKDEKFVKKDAAVTCQRLKDTPIKCNMPGNVFDNTFTVANGGCGPCDATAKAANKCAECDSAECNVMPSPIKCIQGDGSDMTAKDCLPAQGETTPTKCSQAKFVEYTGLAAGQNYACGACAANSDANKCQDCVGKSDAACNTKIETAESFKCYDYELKDEKLVKKEDAVTCQRLKDTPIKCNMPGSAADKTYSVKNNGCGPCETADKTSNKCADCDKGECNSAFAVTALLLPLLAAIYSLL